MKAAIAASGQRTSGFGQVLKFRFAPIPWKKTAVATAQPY
jgi:hypothetical protein